MSPGERASAFPAPRSRASSLNAGTTTEGEFTLVSAAKSGDLDAWSKIYRQNHLYVLHVCRGFLKNDADQEEAAQDTFLRAWKGLKGFHGDAKLSTWLVSIAQNVCRSRLKQLKCPMNDPKNYFFLDALWSARHPQWSAEDRFEATDIADPRLSKPDTNTLLEQLLARLSESQGKDALLQFHLEGVSDEELAAQLGLSVKAVQRLREKELAKLKNIAKKLGEKPSFDRSY